MQKEYVRYSATRFVGQILSLTGNCAIPHSLLKSYHVSQGRAKTILIILTIFTDKSAVIVKILFPIRLMRNLFENILVNFFLLICYPFLTDIVLLIPQK